jgi:hypothetical protein
MSKKKKNIFGGISFISSIVSFVNLFIYLIFSYIAPLEDSFLDIFILLFFFIVITTSILGLVFGIISHVQKERSNYAIVGIVISSVVMFFLCFVIVLGIIGTFIGM